MTASEDGAGVSMHSAWIQKKREIVKRKILKSKGTRGRWTDFGKGADEGDHKAVFGS